MITPRVVAAVLVLALVGAAGAARAQSAAQPPADDREAQAVRLFDEGRYAEAAELLQQVLASRPDDRTANVLLAFAFARGGDATRAIAQARQALSLLPDNEKLQLLLAGLLSRDAKTVGEARDRFRAVLQKDPNNKLAAIGAAEIESANGNLLGSIEMFSRLAERYPDDPRFQVRIAQAWASLGDLERSREHYLKAYALASNNVDAVRSLAILADVLDRPDEAVRYYRELSELYPGDVSVQVSLQRAREAMQEPPLPASIEEMQKTPLQAYVEGLEKNSTQLQRRREQMSAVKVRSGSRFLPQFFVSPSHTTIDSPARGAVARDETSALGFSFGWNIADMIVDPYQINLKGLQADFDNLKTNLTIDVSSTYYQRLDELANYRNLQRALALDPGNAQLRANKRSLKLRIIALTERLKILTGRS